ncbi:MAG: DUF1002 domain-containing protein [Lachnospiraceae bacterium]|nr:DUF1002 domain-containing protein [Lachnospiraceae bacterium]
MKGKRLVALLLGLAVSLGNVGSVWAADSEPTVISFDDNGSSQESVSGNSSEVASASEGTASTASTTTKTQDAIAAAMAEAPDKQEAVQEQNPSVNYTKAFIALGADLSADQKNTVLALMGIPAADLDKYDVVYVTNAEEHAGLDTYIAPSLIGTKSLSSVLVRPALEGYGVVVHTVNINYCTENMYRNALITAGVQNADITVVAPFAVSGTAALIGALKAYEDMSGTTVADNTLDVALNELVTTSELSETLDSSSEAEELISYIKAQVAANDLDTEEEIDAAIRKGMKEFNVTLSEEDIKAIISLMMRIKDMGIDFSVLADQAEDIYAKYKDQIEAGTFDIKDVKLEDLGLGKLIANATSNFFKNVVDSVKDFFGGLFSKKK